MSETDVAFFMRALSTVLVVLAAMWLVWRARRARDEGENAARAGSQSGGEIVVPVKGIYAHNGFVSSQNSMFPAMSIAPDGIRFRVLSKRFWLFTEIDYLDVRKTMFGFKIVIVRTNKDIIAADVRTADVAKGVLTALPRTLRLTAEAANLRDGSDAAAAPGLRGFRGRIR